MMRLSWLLFVLAGSGASAQQVMHTDTCGLLSEQKNVYSYRFAGDSSCTSFVITIQDKVAPHKHLSHSEHVLVLEGEGEMQLGEKTILLKKGDLVFIPKNTVHAAYRKGKQPLRVLSIQAPAFDGSDRVYVK